MGSKGTFDESLPLTGLFDSELPALALFDEQLVEPTSGELTQPFNFYKSVASIAVNRAPTAVLVVQNAPTNVPRAAITRTGVPIATITVERMDL